jgi:hypothetical protein
MEPIHSLNFRVQIWLLTIAALTALCLLVSAVWAANDFWNTKDWTRWNEMQCFQITGKASPSHESFTPPPASPWAKSVYSETVPMGAFVGVRLIDELGGQFRSALPIRLALARQMQLEEHYEKLNPEQRQAAENQIQADLGQWAEKSQAQVIFHVTFSRYQTGNNGQARISQQMPRAANLLFPDGRHFTSSTPLEVQQDDFSVSYDVTFPREVDGKPLIRAEDKKFKVAFEDYYKQLEFDASKMMFRGKLEY